MANLGVLSNEEKKDDAISRDCERVVDFNLIGSDRSA
jgi:hypothetical protein